jgi:hypothetical protein
MTDLIKRLEESLTLAEAHAGLANAAVTRINRELAEARALAALEQGHPWAGKRVRRQEVRRATYEPFRLARAPDKLVTVRGTVTLCQSDKGVLYRGHWPQAGEWFVVSATGMTAYKLGEGWELDQ